MFAKAYPDQVKFYPKTNSWKHYEGHIDIALPCATQNEVHKDDVEYLFAHGCKYLIEGANMPCDNDAITLIKEKKMLYGPGKAANGGGVATSGLEMS